MEKISEFIELIASADVQPAGDGVFICFKNANNEVEKLANTARDFFNDVQFCPEPDLHGNYEAVLNCFYPIKNYMGYFAGKLHEFYLSRGYDDLTSRYLSRGYSLSAAKEKAQYKYALSKIEQREAGEVREKNYYIPQTFYSLLRLRSE